MTVGEYDPGSALAIGDAQPDVPRAGPPRASRTRSASRPAAAALVFTGDTAVTPALAELASRRRPAAQRGDGAARSSTSTCPPCDAGRIAREAGCKALVLTHVDVRERAAALRQAREAFGGPVLAAVPGLRVAAYRRTA